MMVNFTFVNQGNSDGRSRRGRSRKACGDCRSKKRRCAHQRKTTVNSSSLDAISPTRCTSKFKVTSRNDQADKHKRPPTTKLISTLPSPTTATYRPSEIPEPTEPEHITEPTHNTYQVEPHANFDAPPNEASPRFVGDLNPEARLVEEEVSPGESQGISPEKVGVWVQARPGSKSTTSDGFSLIINSHDNVLPNQLYPSISDLVKTEDILTLSNLYFANIHPMVPILNEKEYRQCLANFTIPMALAHVVCLIAAKDNAAGPYLKLLSSGETRVAVKPFCLQLHKSITRSISSGTKPKKITLIRILGLLSLHHQGSDGAEEASGYIAQAMHHAQTFALHLQRPSDENCEMRRTFWCLWTLDRLNAATNSRPCIMNDIDISVEPLTPAQSGSVAFDIWFRISKTLNSVIGLYRPTNPETITGIDFEYLGFEQIVEDASGWHLPSSTLATLRIFFLATAILAHRLKTIQTLPASTAASLRQQLSAIQIIRFMQDNGRLESLHPLPVIVYAASLALSVSYQQFRYSRLTMHQEEARDDFDRACSILLVLQHKWSAADHMASLAHRVSIELGKIPSLALLRANRGESRGRDFRPTGQILSAQGSSPADIASSGGTPGEAGEVDAQNAGERSTWKPEGFGLFEGMDDISWMYLDAENPISFDNLPFFDFGTGFFEPQVP